MAHNPGRREATADMAQGDGEWVQSMGQTIHRRALAEHTHRHRMSALLESMQRRI